MPPIVDLANFFTGKLALMGRSNTVLSTRSVLWASIKYAKNAFPRPYSRLGRGTPHPRPLGTQLLCPQCKILATPLMVCFSVWELNAPFLCVSSCRSSHCQCRDRSDPASFHASPASSGPSLLGCCWSYQLRLSSLLLKRRRAVQNTTQPEADLAVMGSRLINYFLVDYVIKLLWSS